MEKKGATRSNQKDYYINISANSNTRKSVLVLEDDYQVDFNHQNSIARVFGFINAIYTCGFHETGNVVNILSINSILVNIDIISGSYVNGSTKRTQFTPFFRKLVPDIRIIESPVNLVYLSITMDVTITITDQDNNLFNLRDEKLTIRFHIRETR